MALGNQWRVSSDLCAFILIYPTGFNYIIGKIKLDTANGHFLFPLRGQQPQCVRLCLGTRHARHERAQARHVSNECVCVFVSQGISSISEYKCVKKFRPKKSNVSPRERRVPFLLLSQHETFHRFELEQHELGIFLHEIKSGSRRVLRRLARCVRRA